MSERNIPNYYAIIPAHIRYCKELKYPEMLLYGEITALSNYFGYCIASNRYFADLYGVIPNSASRWISHLEKLGFVKVEIIRDENKKIIERKIYIIDNSREIVRLPYLHKRRYPLSSEKDIPIFTNELDNNININKIDRLFNNIINNTIPISEDFTMQESKAFKKLLEKLDFIFTKEVLEIYTEENKVKAKIIVHCLKDIFKSNIKVILGNATRIGLLNIYNKCKEKEFEYLKTEKEINSFYNYYLKSVIRELDR